MDVAVDAAVRRVMQHTDFSSKFKHPVKFNGTDFVEQRLTAEQQLAEVSKNALGKMHVFLERYGALLQTEDLRALVNSPAAATAEARFWLERLLKEPLSTAELSKRRRRRRWVWAKREMAESTGFFSEEEMKRRDPQLFHRVVGQYIESGVKLSAPMQGSLSGYLMQQLERECDSERVQPAPAGCGSSGASAGAGLPESLKRPHSPGGEADLDDDDEDLDGMSGVSDGDSAGPGGTDDAAVRRAKFLKTMRNRFVEGHERDFNYKPLDEDSDLDDVVELGRDAEERYFDDE